MNKQGPNDIEWTQYTWNPITGCKHGCAWKMPDGQTANCYAEDVADRMPTMYPQGFEGHYYHPRRLDEPLKLATPSRIFVGSMTDLFGHWVPASEISAILDVCRQAPQHQFQFLTKNPRRLEKFSFPANCWVGISAPPSEMMGKPLTIYQQVRWFTSGLLALSRCDARIKWVSFEPLSFNIAATLANLGVERMTLAINWAVIGAASRGRVYYLPREEWLRNLLVELDRRSVPVFFKGNLHGLANAIRWREELPPVDAPAPAPVKQQLSLL